MLTFSPTSAFMSVDLPTLGLPTMATWPHRKSGIAALLAHGARDRNFRRRLFGRTPAAAASGLDEAERRDAAFDLEHLGVGFAGRRDDHVFGHREPACL